MMDDYLPPIDEHRAGLLCELRPGFFHGYYAGSCLSLAVLIEVLVVWNILRWVV